VSGNATRSTADPKAEGRAAAMIADEESCAEATQRQVDQLHRRLRTLESLGQRLRKERKAQGLSLADMQGLTGMSRSACSNIENARRANPTVETIARYAEALGFDLQIRLSKSD